MALTKYTAETNVIGTLGTTPEDRPGMTDQELKDTFDKNAKNFKTYNNEILTVEIDALIAAIKGEGWTSESLAGLAELVSTNTQQINNLDTEVDAHKLEKVHQYEEGTWTPVLSFDGTTTGLAFTHNAKYTKIGNKVFFNFTITMTAKGTGVGTLRIGGFPFIRKTADSISVPRTRYLTYPAGTIDLSLYLIAESYAIINASISGGLDVDIKDTNIANNTVLACSGFYEI